MAYTFKYQLMQAPEARIDGSGGLAHQIHVYYEEDGVDMGWLGRHKTIVIPGDVMQAILAMPHTTGPERQAKNQAYKDALVQYLNYQPVAVTGWSVAQLTAFLDGNKLSAEVAAGANDYITDTLGQSYPVPFNI